MELFEAIASRHSYRGGYKDQQVPREHLQRIVEAGIRAPSGMNAQTTTFVVVDDPLLVAEIAALHPRNLSMKEARAYIVCVTDRHPPAVTHEMQFQREDCAAAVENMLLAITALGYASVWVDGWLRVAHNAELVGSIIRLPEDKVVRIILPIGVPTDRKQQAEKLPFEKRAWFNRYGSSA